MPTIPYLLKSLHRVSEAFAPFSGKAQDSRRLLNSFLGKGIIFSSMKLLNFVLRSIKIWNCKPFHTTRIENTDTDPYCWEPCKNTSELIASSYAQREIKMSYWQKIHYQWEIKSIGNTCTFTYVCSETKTEIQISYQHASLGRNYQQLLFITENHDIYKDLSLFF